jgi:hypothetical protein
MSDVDWFMIVAKYFVPGMLILAIIGVLAYNMGDSGAGNIFGTLGKGLFSLK